ncbi:hypothetical protein [Streptomyces acidicola]|uniref:hypothetical protein n=1 Tax=Streptomyces acidicola TaxID=2596892 RepID=UPI0037FF76B1
MITQKAFGISHTVRWISRSRPLAHSGSASRRGWSSTRAPRLCWWAEEQFEEHGGVFNVSNLVKNDPTAGEGE